MPNHSHILFVNCAQRHFMNKENAEDIIKTVPDNIDFSWALKWQ